MPILKKTHNRALEMVEAAQDRIAKMGFGNPFDDTASELKNETVAVWHEDDMDGNRIWLRAMLDGPRLETETIYDLKTTESAHPKAIAARAKPMGHDMQDVFYRRGVTTLRPHLNGRLKFIFFYVETKYPFSVVPVELNGEFKTIAQSRVERAIHLWRTCLKADHWPAYANGIIKIEPKPWDLMAEFGAENTEAVMAKI